MEEIRFDDVAKLQTKVTEEWGDFGGTFTVSQEIINQFADFTGEIAEINASAPVIVVIGSIGSRP